MNDDNAPIPHPLWKVELDFGKTLDAEKAEKISCILEDLAVSVFIRNTEATDGNSWTVTLTTMGKPDRKSIETRLTGVMMPRAITAEKLPEKDWLSHVHENFPPVAAGRFFIYGSHYKGDVPEEKIPLKIDAATAFGSGEHETTKGCLLALEEMAAESPFGKNDSGRRGLDMGCGSGILGIAMQKLWPLIRVTAVDIDPESITVTKRHAKMNGTVLEAMAGSGYATAMACENAPYDIIAANILAGPLIDMAADLAQALRPGGQAVLSGLLARQEKDVAAAHQQAGLRIKKSFAIGDWRAIWLSKP